MNAHSPETAAALTPQQLGSLLGRSTRKIDKPCLECAGVMLAVTIRREFCSARCRQKHWLRRLNSLGPGDEMVYVRRRRGDPFVPSGSDSPN